jgi:glycosyltransferase involved in cell wall biosynthesis
MRILQFGRYDFSELQGGVQFYADSLSAELRKSIVVDQLVSSIHPQTKVKLQPNGVKIAVASYGILASVPLSPAMIYWGWRLIFKNKYDLIHLNFPDPLAMFVAWFLPKKIPIVVTWHSDVIRQKWALKVYLPLLKRFMKRVSKIFVATPYHLGSCPQLADLKMDSLVEVVPFGIDPEKWKESEEIQGEAKKLRDQFPQKFLLLAVGRHVYYKGFEFLLKALESLPNCHLLLAGTGPLTNKYKSQLKEAKIEDRVSFVGLVSEEKLSVLYHACDVFCFPSVDKTEAYGYAQLEAMMCGRAVISTRLNNGVNYLNMDSQTGFVVPIKDSQSIEEAINKLVSNRDLLKEFSENAKKRAMGEFTIQKMGERMLAQFRKLS